MKPIDKKMIEMLADRLEVICVEYSFSKFTTREDWQEFYDNAAQDILEGLRDIFMEEK